MTGASGALGSGVVRALSASGRRVIAVERDAARAQQAFAGVANCRCSRSTSARVRPGRARSAIPKFQARSSWQARGRAARAFSKPAATRSGSTVMSANLETARVSLQALLPRMVLAKAGSIVAIGSRTAPRPWEGAKAAAYAASKAAVIALVQACAAEVLADGVRINAVLPSTIDTPANRAAMPKHDPSQWVSVESLSGVIAFLLSDAARDISGAAIPVFGKDGV
ncbi:MAG: SDR family NAD(P)-dependent oxidoreductase [Pseudomonadota bacterium]